MTAARHVLAVVVLGATSAAAQETPQSPPLPPPPTLSPPSPLPPGARPTGVEAASTPLALDEVLQTLEATFPLLAAAEEERAIADGQALATRGAFDLTLRARDSVINGSFDSHRFDAGFEQPTPWNGVSFQGGYRIGAGQFPVYYGDRKTAEGGEFRAGVLFPLLRDRAIDRRRAAVQQADLNRLLAEPAIQRLRIDYYRAATLAYWNWVAAGRRYELGGRLLRVAVGRNDGLRKMAEAKPGGTIAGIDVIDNDRVIVERQTRLLALERRLQQAALELSLYLRDGTGAPAVPLPGRLPPFPEPVAPDLDGTESDIVLALSLRPEPRRLGLQRDRAGVDLRLAENQMLPGVNAVLNGAQDVGAGKKELDRYTYEAALVVDMPLQRREARGRRQTAQATIAQLTAQQRFAVDRITTDVRDAVSALDRGYELRRRAAESVRLAEEVERGEVRKLERSATTILNVNLRELVTFDARVTEVDALFEYFRALAEYRAALGLDGTPCRPATPPLPPAGR